MENIAWAKLDDESPWIPFVGCGHNHKEVAKAEKCLFSFHKRMKRERPSYHFRIENGMFQKGE